MINWLTNNQSINWLLIDHDESIIEAKSIKITINLINHDWSLQHWLEIKVAAPTETLCNKQLNLGFQLACSHTVNR